MTLLDPGIKEPGNSKGKSADVDRGSFRGRLATCVPSLQQRTGAALKPLGTPIGDEEIKMLCVCVT